MNHTPLFLKWAAGLVLVVLAFVGTPALARNEPLYFALEVRRDGRLIAQPKLLGESGRILRAERRIPGALVPDYSLVLTPKGEGNSFRLELDLTLPEAHGHSELALLHGQERKLQLGRVPGELEVSLLLMKVDSPEFRALMDLGEDNGTVTSASCSM
ncbi:hypothetical protein DRW03_31245 [Corallococcus sp. H22C18031201]|uniref:hypothetical protein n=1 Tax=Citreicoccus inhibens TaxID=2849499 RepID=UPI000E73E96F|nr:hypothetical protein [Citreicoccus inhibens]MBU8894418.1 hypothetical protein [Citreicoccus inhibens]RJS16119.1 hypothetical protein DRW03_31245 [Corallococcus sp. H22C18031201]